MTCDQVLNIKEIHNIWYSKSFLLKINEFDYSFNANPSGNDYIPNPTYIDVYRNGKFFFQKKLNVEQGFFNVQ